MEHKEHYDQKDLIQAFREGNAYDYVATHYWEMSKEELKDVILETLWHAAEAIDKGYLKEITMLRLIADEIEDRWSIGEER